MACKAQLFPNHSPIERINIFDTNGEIIPRFEYWHVLSEEEMQDKADQYAKDNIELERLAEEKATLLAKLKAEIDQLKASAKITLAAIRNKRVMVVEKCWEIQDLESGDFGIYNSAGELLEERKARAGEQRRLPLGASEDYEFHKAM